MTPSNQNHTSTTTPAGKEKRRFKRHSVALEGVCHLENGNRIACEIQDICLNGMFIIFRQALDQQPHSLPAINDSIKVECFLPLPEKTQTILVNAQIVRPFGEGIGIKFNNPDQETLRNLDAYINGLLSGQGSVADTVDITSDQGGNHADHEELIEACNILLAEAAAPIASGFLSTVDEQLFIAARDAKSNVEQSRFFDAMTIFKRFNKPFQESYLVSIKEEIASLSPQSKSNQSKNEYVESELSIMGDDNFENWLAAKNIINQVQLVHHELLLELMQRLSTLFQCEINSDNNPYGPDLYVNAFEHALKDVDLDHNMSLYSYTAFKDILTDKLKELYTSINLLLDKNDIQPALKTKKSQDVDRHSKSTQDPQTPQTSKEYSANHAVEGSSPGDNDNNAHHPHSGTLHDTHAYTGGGSGSGVSSVGSSGSSGDGSSSSSGSSSGNSVGPESQTSHNTAVNSGNSISGAQGNVTDSAMASATGQGNFQNTGKAQDNQDGNPDTTEASTGEYIGKNSAASNNTAEHQDIYQLVQELRQLKKQLNTDRSASTNNTSSNTLTGQDQSALTGEENISQPEQFTTEEIMGALSILQKKSMAADPGNPESSDIESMTLGILKEHIDSSADNKRIAERDSNIMDVTGNLFESLLNDMLVADSVRQWIKKLEIPMLKLALMDESIFVDKNHVARQVVNKISQLEGYTNKGGSQNAIWKKIDRLLDRIVDNIDNNPAVFNQALHEVDAMVAIQNKAYGENIQDVIRTCNDQYAVILKNRESSPRKIDDKEYKWQPWEKQARRLQIGDWLLFSNTSSSSQRLRLAWVSEHLDYYVFVNLKGLKEIALDLVELSMRLRDSTAIVIGSADEPALDRAQHSMLDRLHKQLIHESTHDQLTGLINRREFERVLDTRISRCEEQQCQFVLCYIDIANFNIINSSYGYEAGDKLLMEFTDMLLRSLNGAGLLGRVGGDTYTLLLESTTAAEARSIIQVQIDTFKNYRFECQAKHISISLNVGLVPINDFNTNAAELMRTAEICCRTAKEKGNNQIHIYQRDDQSMIFHQQIIQHVLQIGNTLERGNIELRCQRIAPIQTDDINEPYHSEILIGIKDEEGSIIPTQDFILAAEHYNRITAVDRWVVARTFEWIKQNMDMMPALGGLAINLSGRSINDESFLNYVLDQIEKSGVPTEWICFEITETSGIANLSDATVFINKLKDTGCHFSLDDFGSGLSSYAYLKNLPVDYLKIDGTFVREMDKNQTDYAVVKSICEIGHFMGKKIIAEFVENDTILELLREIGVDYAQGYGIDKPKPLNDLLSAKDDR